MASCISLANQDFASLCHLHLINTSLLPRTSKMSAKIEKIIVRLQQK
jgi:hypothetical protein